jgi:hypothetical protein
MNLSKLISALLITSFAVVAGCAAQTTDSATGEDSVASQENLRAASCTGLSTNRCEATTGCMEESQGCVVSCTVNAGCITKCNTKCAPLDCSALANSDCGTYAGSQCQLARSCVVSCRAGANAGCTTTCHNSCQPTTVACANLSETQCAANASRCQVHKGACLVSCTLGTGCVTKCAPSTCGSITE